MSIAFDCPNCPSEELRQLCKEISDMRDFQVLACEEEKEGRFPLAYLELQQTIRVSTPANPKTMPFPVRYRYYLNLDQGQPNYEGTFPFAIDLRDPETFIEQFIQINNIGDDVQAAFSWNFRLDTHDVTDIKNIPPELGIKLSRQDSSNHETYVSDFIKATVELDAAVMTFFQKWTPPASGTARV